jgi:hypothetical protein
MEQIVDCRSVGKEIPCLSRDPNVHYRFHKSLPLVPIQLDDSSRRPVKHLCKILILSSHLRRRLQNIVFLPGV